MSGLLKEKYNRVESLRGKGLLKLLGSLFFAFLILGLLFGYILNSLSGPEDIQLLDQENGALQEEEEVFYEGTVTYVDPKFHPYKDISYELTDSKGKTIILLGAKDQKLVVAEGHYAKVYGEKSKTEDGEKDLLIVEKVVISNVSN